MTNNHDDDIPCLSAESLKALQEFLTEQAAKENKLQNQVSSSGDVLLGTSELDENWVRIFPLFIISVVFF